MLNPLANPLYRQVLYDGQKRTNIRTLQNHKNQIDNIDFGKDYKPATKNNDKITTNLKPSLMDFHTLVQKPKVNNQLQIFFKNKDSDIFNFNLEPQTPYSIPSRYLSRYGGQSSIFPSLSPKTQRENSTAREIGKFIVRNEDGRFMLPPIPEPVETYTNRSRFYKKQIQIYLKTQTLSIFLENQNYNIKKMQDVQKQNSTKFKVVFLGDENVGKTAIIESFIYDTIPNQYKPTIGIDFASKIIYLDGQNVRLQIWDTAGQERFKSLIPTYVKDSKAAVLCYNVENLQSFENIKKWLSIVREEQGYDVQIILVANKIDVGQNRAVPLDQGVQFALNNNMLYYECSAKEGINIQQLFKDIAIKLSSDQTRNPQASPQETTPQQQNVSKEATPEAPQQQTSVQPEKKEQTIKFKLVFLGDDAVGKTAIISQFVLNQTIQKYEPTIGIDFLSKSINIDGNNVRLQLWETAGKEKFRALIPSYIKDSKAAIIIFDVTHIQTFQNIPIWMDLVKQHGPHYSTLVLIANKVDLKQNRVVSEDVGLQFAADNKMIYYESSIFDANGLTKIFLELSSKLLEQFQVPNQ
ncbi:hypothetical protein pb186bvf_001128 [Paramecium bursaria]